MPEIRISLDDEAFQLLKSAKGKRTWKEFLVSLVSSREQLLINEINEFFDKLKTLDPENYQFYEIMRVSLIAFTKNQNKIAIKMLRKTIELLDHNMNT